MFPVDALSIPASTWNMTPIIRLNGGMFGWVFTGIPPLPQPHPIKIRYSLLDSCIYPHDMSASYPYHIPSKSQFVLVWIHILLISLYSSSILQSHPHHISPPFVFDQYIPIWYSHIWLFPYQIFPLYHTISHCITLLSFQYPILIVGSLVLHHYIPLVYPRYTKYYIHIESLSSWESVEKSH